MRQKSGYESTMRIRISALSNGIHEYHLVVDPPEVGLAENFRGKALADIRLDKSSRQIYLRADIRTTARFNCDRCLDEFERTIAAQYTMVYLYSENDRGKYPAEEVQIIDPETTFIDPTDDIRQMVMLSVPLKLLCKDTCQGLCPHCGTNWNCGSCQCKIDFGENSAWSSLRSLLNNR